MPLILFFTRDTRTSIDVEHFRYIADKEDSLIVAVVSAVAEAHHEDIIEQDWIVNNDINTDAFDGLFQDGHLDTTLRFEADMTTVTIDADERGNPVIEMEPHR